jgi:phosphoribosylpyrophosphate synthetase
VPSGEYCGSVTSNYTNAIYRVTAMADKLGVEFALIHRKRDGKSEDAPERMEILVGDVRDKVRIFLILRHSFYSLWFSRWQFLWMT